MFPDNATNQILAKALQYESVSEFKFVGLPINIKDFSKNNITDTNDQNPNPTHPINTNEDLCTKYIYTVKN